MKTADITKVLSGPVGYLIVGGGVILVAYFLFKKITDTGKKAGSEIGGAIVDTFSLDQTDVHLLGQVILPTGQGITLDDIARGSGIDANGSFTYLGRRYTISTRNADGNYIAR